jgi:hypothetical protein
MNELFNRAATLIVGPSTGGLGPLLSARNPTKFEGFRIAFEIDKNSEAAPNVAKVHIYNLKQSSRAELEATGLVMILQVGYSGIGQGKPLVSSIFSGDLRKATTKRQGADMITTLEAGDGEKAITEARVEQTFGESTAISSVINVLAKKLGVAVGKISPALGDVVHGLSLTGNVADNLTAITAKAGLEWFVSDGELHILAPRSGTNEPAILLTPETGLIGIPNKTNEIVEVESLINPGIKPGRMLRVESKELTGTFRVRRARYEGDTEGQSWRVAVEAV